MKKTMMTTLLISAMAIGGTALAANEKAVPVQVLDRYIQAQVSSAEQATPRPVMKNGYQTLITDTQSETATRFEWIASSGTRSYYLALRGVVAAFPNEQTDMYRVTVREVPAYYYVRDTMIPEREKANLSVAGYENYAYSMVTYEVRVERKAGVEGNVLNPAWSAKNTVYNVAKLAQKDYNEKGALLGEQHFHNEMAPAAPGSDAYTLATGLDQKVYNYRPAGR